ncbi:Maf family nucleotide pyrophosphatase [Anditalea andensis]|uniref:dTTP/UTP pyrophosphatase n=1 Tax=Anditalea andensis TaxID=1048983 RepID=A0A074KY28_9BACT|nr:Maf family protein [Anditalea andensis]KEO72508.1 septum formation inhibitor Maf [Anditalea andensis]
MISLKNNIILGSKSPRRQDLLKGLDIDFEVLVKDTDESYPPDLDHTKIAIYLAEKKADAFSLSKNDLLITADTVVLIGNSILEKPINTHEAHLMLKALSGQKHTVITGVCMRDLTKKISFDDITEVHFAHLSDAEIEYYINRYHPFDKAGSYGVQEWIGYVAVNKMEGSFYTVMGLPVHKVYEKLKNW